MQVKDESLGISFPVLVQYPTNEKSTPMAFGPYTMDVRVDAKISDGQFPAATKNPNFLPSTDPAGFDREVFHKELPTEILNFLNKNLNYKSE